MSNDYLHDILDEIALEGLDGITLEVLWMRLTARKDFSLKIDKNTKKFIWKTITCIKSLSFYELPQPRKSIKYFDYSIEENAQEAALELDEIYPYHSVKNVPGIYGSCLNYFVRVDVTHLVINTCLEDVEEKYGNTLVVVASQEARNSALLGYFCTPNIDFSKTPIYYDLLEKIGRCRNLGVATHGKGSIQSIIEDSKSIFHYLKFLLQQKLVKKQFLPKGFQLISNTSKIYLTRFFEKSLDNNLVILQIAVKELKKRPNCIMSCDEFYALFEPKQKVKLKKFKKTLVFRKFITLTDIMPYRQYFPNASQSEWERKSKNGEKMVRCYKLNQPDIDFSDLNEKDCEIDDSEEFTGFVTKGIFFKNMSIVAQAYHHIKKSGATGLTHIELAKVMGLNKKCVEGLIKRLCSDKLCQFFIENDGRRRAKRYIVGENMKTKAAACELIEILGQNQEPAKSDNNENLENVTDSKSSSSLNLPQLQEQNISYRTLRRIALIIKLIKSHRFRMFNQIMKHIKDEEINEGLISTVDRLTIKRILQNLEKDGLIKTIKINANSKINYPIKLYTDPTFIPDEKFAETFYQIHSTSSTETSQVPKDLENEFAKAMVSNTIEVKKMLKGIVQRSDKSNQENNKGSELVYSPKFIRLNILHDFIFHLVYDYTGIENVEQDELIEKLSKTINIDEELKQEMPQLYEAQTYTYMFVPPLNNTGKMKGWFLISDLLIRMPLSVFVKILRISEPTKEMSKYIHHPIRKHFLVKDLPFPIREVLLGRKNQISSLCYDLKRLCYMGLLQFGLKFGREHYQTFVYLNRNASLLDTTTSPDEYFQVPENLTFEIKSYYFKNKNDVKRYWMELFNICMGTNLGIKAKAEGKDVLIERDICKETLKKLTDSKTVAQVTEDDNGTLPGDNRGAAGLDSAMFSFLKSNWRGPLSKSAERLKEKKPFKVYFQKIKRELLKKRLYVKKIRRKKAFLANEKNSCSGSEEKTKTGELRKRKIFKEGKSALKRRKMVPFDDVDLEALKLMNTLRVTWSTAEDNLLLICRVAMMFLCPNIRTFVRIPWVEVRKVLQSNLPESCNKTQKAIARRIIYMMKNPTTVRSVNLCLQELKEMPEAMKNFDCSELLSNFKPSAPNLPELQEELHDKFHKLVLFLQNRIVSKTNIHLQNTDKELIPDSLEEFNKKFQFENKFNSSISLRSIRENVIRAVFMSSLSCRADKTSSAVQLFDIYRQYEDDELQSAIKKLHVDKVITVKKKTKNSIFRNENFLPLSFAPYTLSFAFQHLLSMKYSYNVYSESFYQISRLLQVEDALDEEVDLNECNIALFLLASKNYCTFNVTMPDQIIALDSSNLPNAAYTKILERYCNLLKFSSLNSKVICSSGKIITKGEDEEKTEINVGKKRSLSTSESADIKKPKLENDPVKEEGNGKGKNGNKVKNVKSREELEKESDQNFIDKEQLCNDKTTRSSRIILYMMREEAKKDVAQEGIVMQEFFVVNASKVFVKVDKEYLELYSKQNAPKFADELLKSIISRSLVPMNLVDEDEVLSKMKDIHDLKTVKIILDFIYSKKEYGATIKELKSFFESSSSSLILDDFVKFKIVIKCGINETRYVSQKYCAPWVLSSFKMTRLEREKMKPNEITAVALKKFESQNEKFPSKKQKNIIFSQELKTDSSSLSSSSEFNNKVKIIIRPWIRIDGSLNRKVLDRLLGTILSLIMTNPGISIKTIMDKFSPSLTPVWTKDLVEILFDIGCITFTSVFVEKETTLFSKAVIRISESFNGLEEDDFVRVEAKVDALLNLGLFIGKKSYSKDFLE